MTAINLNHKTGTIINTEDTVLTLQEKGGVKIADGTYLNELGNEVEITEVKEDYKGVIRYNNDKGCLQLCDGKKWKNINGYYKQTSNIVWSLLF